jgi:chromate reductase
MDKLAGGVKTHPPCVRRQQVAIQLPHRHPRELKIDGVALGMFGLQRHLAAFLAQPKIVLRVAVPAHNVYGSRVERPRGIDDDLYELGRNVGPLPREVALKKCVARPIGDTRALKGHGLAGPPIMGIDWLRRALAPACRSPTPKIRRSESWARFRGEVGRLLGSCSGVRGRPLSGDGEQHREQGSFEHGLSVHCRVMADLNTVVFMGSARNMAPGWGGPARLGTRVLKYVVETLAAREMNHDVFVVDPQEVKLPVLEAPHFYYAAGEAPAVLEGLAEKLAAADCFVLVSPEYNHSIPPALSNLLNHFGGSKFAGKASGLVTYSSGQWGGVRAAMQLRAITSELGCLSVSRICSIARAGKTLDEEGKPAEPDYLDKMLGGMLNQLEWLADAMKQKREAVGLPK